MPVAVVVFWAVPDFPKQNTISLENLIIVKAYLEGPKRAIQSWS